MKKYDMKIVFIAFNMGYAGKVVNGPGIDLYNLISSIRLSNPNIDLTLVADIHPKSSFSNIKYISAKNKTEAFRAIDSADIIHHWSGLFERYREYLMYSKAAGKKIIVGPNVLDCVNLNREREFLINLKSSIFITMSKKVMYDIYLNHGIRPYVFIVGPDLKLWNKNTDKEDYILWKGNSRHKVKDVAFGLELSRALPQYKFKFLGYPKAYDYFNHIDVASKARLYICTSYTETKCNALMEQWAAGVPSISHPEIQMHGNNYSTGLIVNKNIDSYSKAIISVMENKVLWRDLSYGANNYCIDNFSHKKIYDKYMEFV